MNKILLSIIILASPLVVFGNAVMVSTTSDEQLGNGNSRKSSQSIDGRYIAFDSLASTLVGSDTNGGSDVFLKDMETGTLRLVSASSAGTIGNNESQNPDISSDGRYVVFDSAATNLIAGDTNARHDIFRKDLVTNAIVRVSVSSAGVQGNGYSYRPSMSPDGRYIVFHSDSDNLVAGDTNGKFDVFVRDMVNNTTTRVSVGVSVPNANDDSMDAQISANGRYVVFKSYADNIIWSDSNGVGDIFIRDILNSSTSIVSEGVNGIGNGASHEPQITPDGKYVVFYSHANNLVNGDTNNRTDVFMKEIGVWGITRISTAINGVEGNNNSDYPVISDDGKYVAFRSYASNLVPNDTNGVADVFMKDFTNGYNSEILTRKNIKPGGDQALCGGSNVTFSSDGSYLTFEYCGSDLVEYDDNGRNDIYQVSVKGSRKGNGREEKTINNSNGAINGGANIGYLEYLPEDYNAYGCSTQNYPIVIFLHGNAQSLNPMNLSVLKKEGLGFYVEQGITDLQFNYGGKLHKFIGIIPQQNIINTPWQTETIDKVIQHLISTYRINYDRVYIAGYSYGALGLFEYLALPGKSSIFAAAAPISYVPGYAASNFCNINTLPIRAIGEGQQQNGSFVVDPIYFTNWITSLNACSSPVVNPPAVVDIHTNTKHDQLATYPMDPRGTGFGGNSIFERFLSHERNYSSGSEGTSCQSIYDDLKTYNAPDASFSFKYPSFLQHINYYKTGSSQNRPIYVTVGLPGQRGLFASQLVVAKGSSTASITNIFKKAVSDYRKIFRNSMVVRTENETLAINRRVKIITFGSSQASEQRKFIVAIVKDGNNSFVITARTTEADFDTYYKVFTIMMNYWKFEPQS